MAVTMKDIARQVGVSRPVVSAVLNSDSKLKVAPATRAKIMELVKQTGYTKNISACLLKGQASRTIGILNVNVGQYSRAVLVSQFLRDASNFNYQLLIDSYFQRTDEEYRVDVLNMLRRSPDGMIILGEPPPEVMEIIKIPNVIIQNYGGYANSRGDLYSDRVAGGYMAGLHLLAHKHCKAVYVCTRLQDQPYDKFNGLQQAWQEAGLPENHLRVIESLCHEETVEERLLHSIREEGYTCGLMSNDFVAARALPFLRRNGIRVPEDFALIGYDGDAFAYLTDPPLTTISQSSKEICTKALDLIFERIKDKQAGNKVIRLKQGVKPAFFKGGSCGCAYDLPPILGWTRDMLFLEERFDDRIVKYDDFINQRKNGNLLYQ